MGTLAASTLSTMWLYAQLGQLCEGSSAPLWEWPGTGSGAGGEDANPLMERVVRSLTSSTGLSSGDLGMETDSVRPVALRQALEVVPLLWQRIECAAAAD